MRCECLGNPKLKVGATVKIDNAGTKLSGTYYVTSVDHHFGRRGDMTTTFSTGARTRRRSSTCSVAAASASGRSASSGMTIGIVTNNKDPDGVGRVRVKFPALSDSEESWWARVVTPGAGSSAGLMFMPQIDDEVLVGFEHGDLRRPFVLGGVWGAKAKPPTASETFLANNKVVQWGLRTMNGTTLGIRSGDQPADKHYKVALPDGTTHYMGSDKTEIIAMNKSIELKSGQASILITDKGDIQIKGTNIKLEATQGITVDGLTIAGKAKTVVQGRGRRGDRAQGRRQRQARGLGHHRGQGLTGQDPVEGDDVADGADFIGRGILWPLRVDQSGSIALGSGADDINASIRMAIITAPGERVMRPQFGCRIWDLLFEPINANTLGLMAEAVRDAVSQWEPRVDLEDVRVEPDPASPERVTIDLSYRVKATNDRRNLVFPFYVIPREVEA